jgi:hypothetical protein
MAHAIVLTLVRLVITQRRLLEWETAAAAAARAAGLSARAGALLFLLDMAASPVVAMVFLAMIVATRPDALAVASPFLALWLAAPLVAYWLSQPVTSDQQLLSPEDRRFLRLIARKTWRYFESFMGAEVHGLPPDNFQETPTPRIAHRTSPTNIGMGLLSTLAAHDLGFIRTSELVQRIEATLSTVEGLERFEGHLLNWYDTRALAPLTTRYVSTVDSGNLAGALWAVAEGLSRLAGEPQTASQICQGLSDTAGVARQSVAQLSDGPNEPLKRSAGLAAALRSVVDVLDAPENGESRLAQSRELVPALHEAMATLEPGSEAAFWSRSVATALAAPTPQPGEFTTALEDLARRARAFVDDMNFDFLYDWQRQIFAIGYRLADAESAGADPSLRSAGIGGPAASFSPSRATSRQPLVPPGTAADQCDGAPALLSWSASLSNTSCPSS